jgi:hypothetical protein
MYGIIKDEDNTVETKISILIILSSIYIRALPG